MSSPLPVEGASVCMGTVSIFHHHAEKCSSIRFRNGEYVHLDSYCK